MATAQTESGKASYYPDKWKGRRTSSGQPYHPDSLTAAHRTHPFGTYLRVTNTANGKAIIVKVNDRGPFIKGRVVDLSGAAARGIDMIRAGIASVKVDVVDGPQASLIPPDTLPQRWLFDPLPVRSVSLIEGTISPARNPLPLPAPVLDSNRKNRRRKQG